VPTFADQPRCRRKAHLLTQHYHQRLEQQREAGELACPRRLDLPHRAIRQPHPRHTDLQETLVLKEIQVPVPLGHRVVDGVLTRQAWSRKATARSKVHANRQRTFRSIEIRAGNVPRGADTQCRFEQLFRHRNSPTESRPRP